MEMSSLSVSTSEMPLRDGSSSSHVQDDSTSDIATFQPSRLFYLSFGTLTILAMMVSLDGTSVSVALPVSAPTFIMRD